MTSCNFGTIHFVSDFYFVRQPSHRLNGRKTGRAIGELGNIHHISQYPQLQKEGESLIKKPEKPHRTVAETSSKMASHPEGLLSLTILIKRE